MKKTVSIVTLALVAAGFSTACAVDSGDGIEQVGTGEEAVCQNNQDHAIDAMFADLAAAMEKELGRWETTRDFEVAVVYAPYYQEQVRLKAGGTSPGNDPRYPYQPFGAARCTDGCPTIKALLSFQNDSLSRKYLIAGPNGSQVTFPADLFRNRLVAGMRAQKTCDERPPNDAGSCAKVEAHVMTPLSSRPATTADLQYNNQLNGSCPGLSTLNIFTSQVTLPSGAPLQMLGWLAYKLVWANEGQLPVVNWATWNYDTTHNPYLMFRVLAPDTPGTFPTKISYEPSLDGAGGTSSGSCGTSLLKYSPGVNITGTCCTVNGSSTTTYRPYAVAGYYICK